MYRVHLAAGAAFLAYCVGLALPAESLWFDPEAPVFTNSIEGHAPRLEHYSRRILAAGPISYATVVRPVGGAEPACTGRDGPFIYYPASGPVVGKDLAWWTNSAPDCAELEAGTYWTLTTWTVERPLEAFLPELLDPLLGGILPPKRVTREGPPFTIHEAPRVD